MKKLAYTLAEVLITMTIIGIIAAVTLPMANKFMPDRNKVLYLKTYDSLMKFSQAVTQSNKYYHNTVQIPATSKIYNVTKYPLLDTYTPYVDSNNVSTIGVGKFYKIIYDFLADTSCGNDCFVAKNGVKFRIIPNTEETHILTASSSGTVKLYYQIDIDVNGDALPNAQIDGVAIKEQDNFRFYITPDGAVIPIDKYGRYYIATRSSYRKTEFVDMGSADTTNLGSVNLSDIELLDDYSTTNPPEQSSIEQSSIEQSSSEQSSSEQSSSEQSSSEQSSSEQSSTGQESEPEESDPSDWDRFEDWDRDEGWD